MAWLVFQEPSSVNNERNADNALDSHAVVNAEMFHLISFAVGKAKASILTFHLRGQI